MLVCVVPATIEYGSVQIAIYMDDKPIEWNCESCRTFEYTIEQKSNILEILPNVATNSDIFTVIGEWNTPSLAFASQFLLGKTGQKLVTLLQKTWFPSDEVPLNFRVTNLVAGLYNATQLVKFSGLADTSLLSKISPYYSPAIYGSRYPYDFLVLPQIDTINIQNISTQGGTIKITGSGFSSLISNNTVQLGNANCQIKYSDFENIICQVGPQELANFAMTTSNLIDSGLTRIIVNETQFPGTAGSSYPYHSASKSMLFTGTAPPDLSHNNIGNNGSASIIQIVKGYFRAPITGTYRFYLTGSNRTEFRLSTDNNFDAKSASGDPQIANLPPLCKISNYTFHHEYMKDSEPDTTSKEVQLQENKYYYFEVWNQQLPHPNSVRSSEESGWFSLGVELFAKLGSTNALQASKTLPDIIVIDIKPNATYEKLYINVWNLNSSDTNALSFQILFKERDRNENIISYLSLPLTAYPLPQDVQYAIKNSVGYDTEVTIDFLDANGNIVSDSASRRGFRITLTLKNYRGELFLPVIVTDSSNLTDNANPVKVNVRSLNVPSDPIRGTWTLSYNGTEIGTFPYDISDEDLETTIEGFFGGSHFCQVSNNRDPDDGSKFHIFLLSEIPNFNFNLLTVNNSNLKGGEGPVNISLSFIRSSGNMYYEPIPFEFLDTIYFNSSPRINVTTNGIKAACMIENNCTFSVVKDEIVPVIKAVAWNSDLNALVITLEKYALLTDRTDASHYDIQVQNSSCFLSGPINLVESNGVITCSFGLGRDENPIYRAGNWAPEIQIRGFGKLKVASGVSTSFALGTLSVSPTVISQGGGDLLTIQGMGLGAARIDTTGMSVTLGNQNCEIIKWELNTIVCRAPAVSPADNTLKITVSPTASTEINLTYATETPVIDSISPGFGSAVDQTEILISGSNFGSNVDVYLVNMNDSRIRYPCIPNKESMHTTNISCSVAGGKPGNYTIRLSNIDPSSHLENRALIVDASLKFEFKISVQNLSSSRGTTLGFSQVTLNGDFFGGSPSAIQIQILDPTTGIYYPCRTMFIRDTIIRFFTPTVSKAFNGTVYLVVSDLERYTCTDPAQCVFTFVDQASSLVPMINSINVTAGRAPDFILFEGVNLAKQDEYEVSVLIGETQLNFISANDTTIIAQIPYSTPADKSARLSVNIPGWGNAFFKNSTLTTFAVGYQVTSINRNELAIGGGQLTVNGYGFTRYSQVEIVWNDGSVEICNIMGFLTSQRIQCLWLNDQKHPHGTNGTVQVKNLNGMDVQTCEKCSIILNSSLFGVITSFVTTANDPNGTTEVTVSGTNFGAQGDLELIEIEAYLVNIENRNSKIMVDLAHLTNTSFVIAFNERAIPAGEYIISLANSEAYYTLFDAENFLEVSLEVTGASDYGVFSAVGGGETQIIGGGFDMDAKVYVCGFPVTNLMVLNSTNIYINIPPIITEQLIDEKIFPQISDIVVGYPIADTIAHAAAAFDGDVLTTYQTASPDSECYIGFFYGEEQVVRIDHIRFFLDFNTPPSSYNNGTWEGSNDQKTWTTIAVIDWDIDEYWNIIDTNQLNSSIKYNFQSVRYRHPKGFCNFGEIHIVGQRLLLPQENQQGNQLNCSYRVESKDEVAISDSSVSLQIKQSPGLVFTYQGPKIISKRGGELLTFQYSSNNTIPFPTDQTLYNLVIEGCAANFPSVDEETKTISFISRFCSQTPTLRRDMFKTPQFKLTIEGFKEVSVFGDFYGYFSYWSDPLTWGRKYLPRDGEDVIITQSMKVVLDIDTARLRSLQVHGFLLVENKLGPNNSKLNWTIHLQASRIDVSETGFFVAGRANDRLTGNFTITLLRDETQAAIDTTKFTFVYPSTVDKIFSSVGGYIEIYGSKRNSTHTILAAPAKQGDSNITVSGTPSGLDWQIGDEIALVASDYHQKTEVRSIQNIVAVDDNYQVVLNDTLNYNHYCITELPDGKGKETGTVLLLTRNVVIQGEAEADFTDFSSPLWLYGGEFIYEGPNDLDPDPHLVVDSVLFKSMAKPFNQGFSSAVRLSNIWEGSQVDFLSSVIYYPAGYGITLLGASRLKINETVVIGAMGHGITDRGGFERENVITNNFVVGLRASSYHSFSDMTGYGIECADGTSDYSGNVIAGSEGFGFTISPLGIIPREAYYATNIFVNAFIQQGKGLSGLISFGNAYDGISINGWTPRKYISLASSDSSANPYLQLVFSGFQAYSNGGNGFSITNSSSVEVSDITAAFNADSQIVTVSVGVLTNTMRNNYTNVTLKGKSANGWNSGSNPKGASSPSTGSSFYKNIQCSDFAYCFDTCYQCKRQVPWTSPVTEIQNFTGSNLTSSVFSLSRRRDIILSDTANLTGQNEPSGTYYFQNASYSHLSTLCKASADASYQICDGLGSSLKLVTIGNFSHVEDLKKNIRNLIITDKKTGAVSVFDERQATWTIPVSTTQGLYQIKLNSSASSNEDWNSFTIAPANSWQVWNAGEQSVYLEFPIPVSKKNVKVSLLDSNMLNVVSSGSSLSSFNGNEGYGDFLLNNTNKTLTIVLNGKNGFDKVLLVQATSCNEDDSCFSNTLNLNETINYSVLRNWSNAATWPSGKVPSDGETVVIAAGTEILLDVSTASLGNLIIDGSLYISPSSGDLQLTCSNIWVRKGKLQAGTKSVPFPPSVNFTILLTSNEEDAELIAQNTDVGNNVILVTGSMGLFGTIPPDRSVPSILASTAQKGSSKLNLSTKPTWNPGNRVIITTTDFESNHTEVGVISEVSESLITLSHSLNFTHFGEPHSLSNLVSYQAKVFNIERNIIIKSSNESYGSRILVEHYIESDGTINAHQVLRLTGTQIINGGQDNKNNLLAAITATSLVPNYVYDYIKLSDVVFYNLTGPGIRLVNSRNATVKDCVLHNPRMQGIYVEGITDGFNFLNVHVINVRSDSLNVHLNPTIQERIVGVYLNFGPSQINREYQISDCWVIGSEGAGFVAPEIPSAQAITWENNGAAATQIGWLAGTSHANSSSQKVSDFTAWRNQEGIHYHGNGKNLSVQYNVLADNRVSLTVNPGGVSNVPVAIQSNTIIGTILPVSTTGFHSSATCSNLVGMRLTIRTQKGREYPGLTSQMPFYAPTSNAIPISRVSLDHNTFYNFTNQDGTCMNVSLFKTNDYAIDTTSMHSVSRSTVSNVPTTNVVYFDNHVNTIEGVSVCSAGNCDGVSNTFLKDVDGTLTNTRPGFFVSSALPNITNPVNCSALTTTTKWCEAHLSNTSVGADLAEKVDNSYTFGILFIENTYEYHLHGQNPPNTRIQITSPTGYNNTLSNFADFISQSHTNRALSEIPSGHSRILETVTNGTTSRSTYHLALVPLGQIYKVNSSNPMSKIYASLALENSTNTQPSAVFLDFEIGANQSVVPIANNSNSFISLTDEKGSMDRALDYYAEKCGDYAYDYSLKTVRTLILTGTKTCNLTVHTIASVSFTLNLSMSYNTFVSNDFSQVLVQKIASLTNISPKQVRIHKLSNLKNISATQVLLNIDQSLYASIDDGMKQVENYSRILYQALENPTILSSNLTVTGYDLSERLINGTTKYTNTSTSNSTNSTTNGTTVDPVVPIPSGGGSAWIFILLGVVLMLGLIGSLFYYKFYRKSSQIISAVNTSTVHTQEYSQELSVI